MAEVKVTDLPAIPLEDFTGNDSFIIVDDGKVRRMTRNVFQVWMTDNVKGEKGDQGVAGRDGVRGVNGINGRDGIDGLSAYQIAVQNGFVGSNSEWLNSLKGAAAAKGEDGDRGWSPVFKTESSEGGSYLKLIDWVGGEGDKPTLLGFVSDSGIVDNIAVANNLRGQKGVKGDTGEKGDRGEKGERGSEGFQGEKGLSAYDIVVLNGFEGTEEEWLVSLNPAEVSKAPNNIISKKIDGMFAEAIDPLEMANAIDALEDKNIMTDAQKDKLEALKTSKYLGTYLTSEEIPLEGAEAGNYADVDSGEPDVDTERWIYDVDSNKFVRSSSSATTETSTSIKEKYESNPDTNAFTDELLLKLNTIPTEGVQGIQGDKGDSAYEVAVTTGFQGSESEWILSLKGEKGDSGDDTNVSPEDIKLKYESNPDTNAFTDSEKQKLSSIEVDSIGSSGGVVDVNGGGILKFWTGTIGEYSALPSTDPSTIYLVKEL